MASSAPYPDLSKVVIVTLMRILSLMVGLIYVKYYTNNLSVDQVAHFFYLGTLSYVLNALIFVPMESYLQARLSRVDMLPLRSLLRLVMISLSVGLGVCVVFSVPLIILDLLSAQDMPLLYGLASLLYLCSSVRNLLNIRGQASFAAGMILLESVARLMSFVAVVHILGGSARTLLLSSILALAAELCVLLWQANRTLPLSQRIEPLDSAATILRMTSALAGSAGSSIVQLQAYRVLFPAAGYSTTAGMLGVTANIGATAMSAIAQVFSQLFLPRLYQSGGASIGHYTTWGVAVAVTLLMVCLPISELLVQHLTSSEYLPYASAVGIGIVIEACNMLIGAYGVYLTLHRREVYLTLIQMAAAVLSLGGCLVLLVHKPNSPLLVGLVVAGTQIITTLTLYAYIRRHKKSTAD